MAGKAATLLTLLLPFTAGFAAEDGTASMTPNEIIESSASRMLTELNERRSALEQNPEELKALIDEILIPHFDKDYAARLVLAKHWRSASSEQRERFTEAFYRSLLRRYADGLLNFTSDRLTVLPFRGDLESKRATVRTEVRLDDGTRVPVDYSLRRTGDGWKVWDVIIEGISYIRTFRTDFDTEIRAKGLEAVIARLESEAAGAPRGDAADDGEAEDSSA